MNEFRPLSQGNVLSVDADLASRRGELLQLCRRAALNGQKLSVVFGTKVLSLESSVKSDVRHMHFRKTGGEKMAARGFIELCRNKLQRRTHLL